MRSQLFGASQGCGGYDTLAIPGNPLCL